MHSNLFSPLIDSLFKVPQALYNIIYKLPNYIEYQLPNKETRIGDISIPIGVTRTDKLYLNIGQRNVHTLVTGMSGYGKSNLLNSIICSITQLYPNTELMLYDFKAVEFSQYCNMRNVVEYQYISDNISTALDNLYQTILNRYEQMLSNNKRCISIYDKRTVVIIDEISLCNRKHDIPILEKCMAISRACGIHFILATQRASANDVLSPIIRNLLDTVITFKLDINTSKLTLGTEEASLLDKVGRGIFKLSDRNIEFQSYFISKDTIDTVIKDNIKVINTSSNCKVAIENTEYKTPNDNINVTDVNKNWVEEL